MGLTGRNGWIGGVFPPFPGLNFVQLRWWGICIVGVVFISLFVSRGIINPIILLVKGMKRVAAGDLNIRVESRLKDELGELSESFNYMTNDNKDAREKLLKLEGRPWREKNIRKYFKNTQANWFSHWMFREISPLSIPRLKSGVTVRANWSVSRYIPSYWISGRKM